MTDRPALTLDKVTLQLGSKHFDFDLALSGPQIVAITGPSGSGKSTLLNLIAGFENPLTGEIRINGQLMNGIYPGDRPLTVVFQDNNLFGHLTIADNVGLGLSPSLKLTPDDRKRIEKALADVGLAGFGPRLPQSLSGGERQRVAFARALLRNRPLLLLDEPFAALDPELREGMGELLVTLQKATSALVLIVTHDRAEATRLSDRVIVVNDGKATSLP